MNHTATKFFLIPSLFFLLLIFSASALEFTFDSPSSVNQNEEFQVKIYSQVSENYDVKIYLKDPADTAGKIKIVSETYNSGWKSSFFFIKEAFPSETSFNVKATKSYGNFEICVKLRKSGKTSSIEKCSNIEIFENNNKNSEETDNDKETLEKDSSDSDQEKNSDKSSEKDSTKNKEVKKRDIVFIDNNLKNTTFAKNSLNSSKFPENTENKVIHLNNKVNSSTNPLPNKDFSYTTKTGKSSLYTIYSFGIIGIIIIILLSLRKL